MFQLVGAAFGAAGQRCMALTTAIFVGESQEWIPDLVAKAKELQVNEGLFQIMLLLLNLGEACFFKKILEAFHSTKKLPVAILEIFSGNEKQHFTEFLEKGTTSQCVPKFSTISYPELLLPRYLIFLLEFLNFWLNCLHFRNLTFLRFS